MEFTFNNTLSLKEMAEFLNDLRNRQEMPINQDECDLLGDIVDRMIDIYNLTNGL